MFEMLQPALLISSGESLSTCRVARPRRKEVDMLVGFGAVQMHDDLLTPDDGRHA
jgi:hypothetical protein